MSMLTITDVVKASQILQRSIKPGLLSFTRPYFL